MTPVQKGVLSLIVANVIWGFASPIFKWSLTNIPPFTLAFLRFAIAALILAVILRKKLSLPIQNTHDFWLLMANAVTGITGNIALFFLGLRLTLAMNVPVIASSQPIIVFLLAFLFLNEKLQKKKIFGMLIGTLGILVIVLEPIYYQGMDGNTLGNFLVILATLCGAFGVLTGRKLFQRYNPLVLTFWAFVIGAISFLPPALVEFARQPTLFQQLDIRGITGIVFGAVFSSLIAYSCQAFGLSKIPANEASIFTYVDPIAGTVLSFFMLREPITIPFLIGTGCIFLGIYIAEHRLHYHPFQKLQKNIGAT